MHNAVICLCSSHTSSTYGPLYGGGLISSNSEETKNILYVYQAFWELHLQHVMTKSVLLQFREMGYLAPAMVNYLALLGWNDGSEEEIFTVDQISKFFTYHQLPSSPLWERFYMFVFSQIILLYHPGISGNANHRTRPYLAHSVLFNELVWRTFGIFIPSTGLELSLLNSLEWLECSTRSFEEKLPSLCMPSMWLYRLLFSHKYLFRFGQL